MKEYKILKADSLEHAEKVMNDMAQVGWSVVSTSAWAPMMSYQLAITFERDIP